MTASPYARAATFTDLEEAIAVVREAGSRLTAPRRQLLEALFAADGPVAAERLSRTVSGGDLASVYRNLELLEGLGIVRHFHLGHGPGLYALAGVREREYLVCERCGEIRSVPADELDPIRARIRAEYGFEVRFSHFPIAGLCVRCADEQPTQGGHMSHDHDGEHEHSHDDGEAHAHEHSHGDVTHSHVHDSHDHDHKEHEHEHSHGDIVHSHPHVHQEGLEHEHEHEHGG